MISNIVIFVFIRVPVCVAFFCVVFIKPSVPIKAIEVKSLQIKPNLLRPVYVYA